MDSLLSNIHAWTFSHVYERILSTCDPIAIYRYVAKTIRWVLYLASLWFLSNAGGEHVEALLQSSTIW